MTAKPAYVPPETQPAGVRVKGLEWEMFTEAPIFDGDEERRYWRAKDPLGGFLFVNVHTEDFDGEASLGGTKYRTAAAAMNEVEDLRRDRILAALELQQQEAVAWRSEKNHGDLIKWATPVERMQAICDSKAFRYEEVFGMCGAWYVAQLAHPTPVQKVQESQTVSVTDEMVERIRQQVAGVSDEDLRRIAESKDTGSCRERINSALVRAALEPSNVKG